MGQALAHGQIIINTEELRQLPHAAVTFPGKGVHTDAVKHDQSAERRGQTGDAADQGRLAGPIWPNQGSDAAGPNGAIDAEQSALVRIIENQIMYVDQTLFPKLLGNSRHQNIAKIAIRRQYAFSIAFLDRRVGHGPV